MSAVECFYCHRNGHTALNCKMQDKDILRGNLKELSNIAMTEDLLDSHSYKEPPEQPLKLF